MKKIIAVVLIFAVVIVSGLVWWNSPVHFLDGEEVEYIKVFNGHNGKCYVIEDKEEVTYIVNNIANTELRKKKISLGYLGFGFRLTFFNDTGKEIDEFIINGVHNIRRDPFFYESKVDTLCFEYLQNIDNKIVSEND